MTEIVEKIIEITADVLDMDLSEMEGTVKFGEEMELDDMDMFDLAMAWEEEYGVDIPTSELKRFTCFEDVAKYIEEQLEK